MISGNMILLIIIGLSTFLILTMGTVMLVMFNRRKLIITRFLDRSGKWQTKYFKKLDKTFYHKGCVYDFDISYCTRDKYNRPISSYYEGYPKQILFDYHAGDKNIQVGTVTLSGQDFRQIMLTKIIKDIFSDDDLVMWFIIIIAISIIGAGLNVFITSGHNPQCVLQMDNSTLMTIKEGVRQAITAPVAR